jgi:hypothetical protein
MFIWIGAASLLLLVVSLVKLHKIIALKLLATYYEAEVLEHNGRECATTYSYYIGTEHEYLDWNRYNWERTSEEARERRIHECAKRRASAQSRQWILTELYDWADRTADRMQERKEARINGVIDPLRDKAHQAAEDKRRVEAIVQELRKEPQLTEQEKFDKVFAHFETDAKENKK